MADRGGDGLGLLTGLGTPRVGDVVEHQASLVHGLVRAARTIGPTPVSRDEIAEIIAQVAEGLRALGTCDASGHDVASCFAFHRLRCSRSTSRTSGPVWQQIGMARSSVLASRLVGAKHRIPGPFDRFRPHCTDQDERRVVELTDLEQLPDHHGLQHGADPTRYDDEGIRDQHEVVQPGERRSVLKDLADEWVNVLLERQVDPDADGRSVGVRPGHPGPLVARLHQPRSAAGHDVAAQARQLRGKVADTRVNPVVEIRPGRPENGRAVARRRVGRSRARLLTTSHRPRTACESTWAVASSSPRLMRSESSVKKSGSLTISTLDRHCVARLRAYATAKTLSSTTVAPWGTLRQMLAAEASGEPPR